MSIISQNVPQTYNGDKVVHFTSAKKIKQSFQGYQDLPSLYQWYSENPEENHLGMIKLFGNQVGISTGLFPELLESKSILEVNGFEGSFTYDVPKVEMKGVMTTRDFSHQKYAGIDGGKFKIALNQEFTTGDVLTYDVERGQQVMVTEEEVLREGDSYIHTVTLNDTDKSSYFLSSNLAKGISYFKLSHAILGERGTNFSHVRFPEGPGSMTCEFTLGNMKGVEAYVTAMADAKTFGGAATSTKRFLKELEAEANGLGEIAMVMDVDKRTGYSLPQTARIGTVMEWLVMKELQRLTNTQLLFQKAGIYHTSNGVTRLNEGLWPQLRRGKIIKYARPGGITKQHIKEAGEYIFRGNNRKPVEDRKLIFKVGSESQDNILELFSEEINNQLSRIGMFLGSDILLPKSPVIGNDLHNLELDYIRFTGVFLPGIGHVKIEHEPSLDFLPMQDRFSAGFHPEGKAHTTYSMVIWDAEDQKYSNNKEMPKGSKLIEGGNSESNIYLVKPEGEMTYWGTTYGRYSHLKAGDIVNSHKQLGVEFWAWNAVAVWVKDVSRFLMIELDDNARKGYK